jgi:hypothetical protein
MRFLLLVIMVACFANTIGGALSGAQKINQRAQYIQTIIGE